MPTWRLRWMHGHTAPLLIVMIRTAGFGVWGVRYAGLSCVRCGSGRRVARRALLAAIWSGGRRRGRGWRSGWLPSRRGCRRRACPAMLAAAGPAGGQALQQRAAFPDRAGARLAGLRADVGPDAFLVGEVGVLVGEPLVMAGDEDLPLVAGQFAAPLAQYAILAEVTLVAGAAVHVGAGVGRVRQRVVHRVVGRLRPRDLAWPAVQVDRLLQRPAQALLAQPQPGGPHRPADRELLEHRGDDAGDGLVGVQADLTAGLAPDQPGRQAAAQLAAGGLVLDPALQPGPQHVQLSFGHQAFHAQNQPVVEQTGMIEAVGVGYQRVADPGQVQQPVPGGVVAGQPGDLQCQDDPDLAERDLGDHALERVPLPGDRPGDAQVAVDDADLVRRPAQLAGPGCQVILPCGRLGVPLHLGKGGVADVYDGRSRAVRIGDLAGFTHRSPPSPLQLPSRRLPWLSGRPAATSPLAPAAREAGPSGPGVAPGADPASD